MPIHTLTAAILAVFAAPILAEEQTFTLGEIVVSEPNTVADVTLSNTLTAEQIERIGAKTAAEVLDFVPGVYVARNVKGESSLTMQGFQQDRVLILLDGVPYYETNYGKLDLNQIPAAIIAKVEVTKGASSVLYGPNGMGGVVNIITHKGGEGVSGNLGASAGLYGYNTQTASISMGKNGFSLFGAVERRAQDATRMSSDFDPYLAVIKDWDGLSGLPKEAILEDGGKRENSHLDATNLWLRGGYANDTTEIYASVFHMDTERGRPVNTKAAKVMSDFSWFADIPEYQDTGIDLNGLHRLNDTLTLRGMAYYHYHTDTYRSFNNPEHDVALADSVFSDYSLGGALFLDAQLADWHRLSMSVNYKNDVHKGKTDGFGDVPSEPWMRSELDTWSVAVEDKMELGNLSLVAGLAWHRQVVQEDYSNAIKENNDSDTFDPMLGASYRLSPDTRLYASVAQKTRFATFSEMYDRDAGNAFDLKPERNLSYNLGWEQQFRAPWLNHLQLGLFYHDISDKIAVVESGDDAIIDNIGKARFYGVELTTHSQLTETLGLTFDYSYTYARNRSEDRESDYFRDVPENAVTAIFDWSLPRWDMDANLNIRYKNNILLTDYDSTTKEENVWEDNVLTVDVGVRKYLVSNFKVYLNLTNLFDEFHYEGYGMPNEGRAFELGVDYRF
ncbi:TonB-dependent receptor plug domain-containing protein [Ferrimonas balearica]|uniref:TonB-dependent receptor plug domain-containing protein n=1 Tax=Ferrimonas balearica TaxID=44012 RepID=UPI00214CEC8B|nr:TonB-dependent receptor [Ferrimonas balearica]